MNRIASHRIVLGGTYSRYNSCQKNTQSIPGIGVGERSFRFLGGRAPLRGGLSLLVR